MRLTRCAGKKRSRTKNKQKALRVGAGNGPQDIRRVVFCELGEVKDARRRTCVRGKGGRGGRNRAALSRLRNTALAVRYHGGEAIAVLEQKFYGNIPNPTIAAATQPPLRMSWRMFCGGWGGER
jgi:hypothetical protein